jgi:SAM-dependent methyltransferase
VYAVDRDANALRHLGNAIRRTSAAAVIHAVVADFTRPLELPVLDGAVLANALHFVPYDEQARVLEQIARLVAAGGSIVVVEYERRAANRWVPYPVSFEALGVLTRGLRLGPPTRLATRPSRYSGSIYSAFVRCGASAVSS